MSLKGILATLVLFTGADALPKSRRTIEWEPCPELNEQIFTEIGLEGAPFDCATLPVPLDYTDPKSEKLQLSLFRINATKEPVLGTVLYNPGGPGGTGAENLPYDGPRLMENMGGQFDMVSFDPRGTGNTIPFNCTPSDGSSLTKRDTGVLVSTNVTERFLHGGWDDAVFKADLCQATNNKTGRYLGTTFVARDMLQIVDGLGEDGMLRYYGWSYGSALGEYFAAMFPERVDRMLLDGVVDPNIWKLGHRSNYLVDADAAMQGFVQECAKNKNACAIVNATGATNASEIFEWINMLLEPLAQNATNSEEAWQVYYASKSYIFSQLYWPSRWPTLAQVLVLASQNVSAIAGDTSASALSTAYNHGQDSVDGIRCSDAIFQVSSPEEYLPQVKFQSGLSESFSDIGYEALWSCAAWKMPNKGRYEGNFTAKTKSPILFVNGEYDVTSPIQGAYNASRLFDGSVVLAHSGYGHGIIASPSACVANYISAYFVNGTLPDPGTHCKPDLGPWEAANATEQSA